MQEGTRPGGLTALAVLNFVGTGLDVLGIIALVGMIALGGTLADEIERQAKERAEREHTGEGEPELRPEDREAIATLRSFEETGGGVLGLLIGLNLACAGLLTAAGIGYLRQRRWGRLLGNFYAVASLATTGLSMSVLPREMGGGLHFGVVLALIYPLVTLVFVNTTFRDDLTH